MPEHHVLILVCNTSPLPTAPVLPVLPEAMLLNYLSTNNLLLRPLHFIYTAGWVFSVGLEMCLYNLCTSWYLYKLVSAAAVCRTVLLEWYCSSAPTSFLSLSSFFCLLLPKPSLPKNTVATMQCYWIRLIWPNTYDRFGKQKSSAVLGRVGISCVSNQGWKLTGDPNWVNTDKVKNI